MLQDAEEGSIMDLHTLLKTLIITEDDDDSATRIADLPAFAQSMDRRVIGQLFRANAFRIFRIAQ